MSGEQQIFNTRSRTGNVMMSSSAGTVAYLLSAVMGFVYRTVFIKILSADYLGINGLFTNVLMLLSMTEMGFGAAITYRFYKPIAENDVRKVGELMNFFKVIYRTVGSVIFLIGMCLYPFIECLIKDPGSVPKDVDLHLVYFLFVVQSVISYAFIYRASILRADQKQYASSIAFGIADTLRFATHIVVLWLFKDFTLTVAAGIAMTLVSNITISNWAVRQYRPVFAVATGLASEERRRIVKDAFALMCHRVGNAVVCGTDTLVLARFVSLAATGLYSNYILLFKTLNATFTQVFGGMSASFGNAYAKLPKEEYHCVFRRMQFLALGLSGLVSACFYILVDDFIVLWIGEDMLLPHVTAAALATHFYLCASMLNVTANLEATGLFVRDKIRSLIEAAINLGTSIPLAILYGVPGVVAGTLIGILLTSFWRAPYILFRGAMPSSVWTYWRQYAAHTLFGIGVTVGAELAWRMVYGGMTSWWLWLVKAVLFAIVYLALFALLFGRSAESRYFISKFRSVIVARLKGKGSR